LWVDNTKIPDTLFAQRESADGQAQAMPGGN
jgi:hypothetical protein